MEPFPKFTVLVWTWDDLRLLRIFPSGRYVLVDGDALFMYTEEATVRDDTYVTAVRLDNRVTFEVLHYRYLLDWNTAPPAALSYPKELSEDPVGILNHVASA